MFEKFKEKLKSSLSIFSRKAKEEVAEEVKPISEVESKPETILEAIPEQVKHVEAPHIADSKSDEVKNYSKQKQKSTQSDKSAKGQAAPKHPPGMICDDKKGICIPVETFVSHSKDNDQTNGIECAQSRAEGRAIDMAKPVTVKAEPQIQEKAQTPTKTTPTKATPTKPAPTKATSKTEPKIEPKFEPEPQPVPLTQPSELKKSFFSKAKELFTTKSLSESQFDELFWPLERALLENNVAFDVVSKIKEDLKIKLINKPLPRSLESVVLNSLKESIDSILTTEQIDLLERTSKKPLVIAFFGINGSGKTTTIAKVAHHFQQNHKICVLAAGDTFRAAAIQQLEEHANNLHVKIIKHDYGADAAAVAFDAVKYAQKQNIDVVLIDTAGRLHSDSNLMDELKKIVRVAKPDIKIFVGESITGNDCIEQAQKFDELIGIDGLILTKADVDEKGGTALSISYVTKKPIIYLGMGQNYDDIKPFTKELILENLGLS